MLQTRLMLRALFVLALGAAVTGQALAQWTWRDQNGRITASDLPPPRDIPEKDILKRPDPSRRIATAPPAASAASAAAKPATPLEREVEARKRAAEQEQSAKARAEEEKAKEQRAENCRRARGQIAALESGQRLARTNEKGEREVLDDKGRAEELRRAREITNSDCR
jgi:type IV secretory pathway VirB10-like protein